MTDNRSSPGSSALPSTEEQLADYVYSIQNYTDAKEVAAHLWPILNAAQAGGEPSAAQKLLIQIDRSSFMDGTMQDGIRAAKQYVATLSLPSTQSPAPTPALPSQNSRTGNDAVVSAPGKSHD